MEPVNLLQVALKNSVDVFYYQTAVPLHVLYGEDGKIADQQSFNALFGDAAAPELKFSVGGVTEFASRFDANNVFLVHQVSGSVGRSAVLLSADLALDTRTHTCTHALSNSSFR